jgi:hypothetical protein
MTKPSVVIGWVFPSEVAGWFCFSLADLIRVDGMSNGYLQEPNGGMAAVSSGPRVAEARNTVIDEFAKDYPNADWLLFLDADMTFPPTLLNDLMAVATPEETPILGGLCFTGGRFHDPHPTIYREVAKEGDEDGQVSIVRVDDYPRDALVKVGATGAACLLIHRSVLAYMKERYGKLPSGLPNPYPWFAEGLSGPHGEAWGEDMAFCMRAKALGIPIHVLTSVKLGHQKHHIIDETYFDNWRRSKELDDLWEKASGETPAANVEHGMDQIAEIEERRAGMPDRAERRRRARERVS